jgi:hypothetical protein
MTGPRPAPGLLGYAVALALSVGFLSVFLAVLDSRGPAPFMLRDVIVFGTVLTLLAAVVGPMGVFVVDLLCRGEPRQMVHVLVAGLVGVLAAVGFGLVTAAMLGEAWVSPSYALATGVATATSRALVIPLVVSLRGPSRS